MLEETAGVACCLAAAVSTSVMGSNMNRFPWSLANQKTRIMLFSCLCHFDVFRHRIAYVENFSSLHIEAKVTVSRPVCLVVKPHLGPKTRFLLLSGSCGFVDVGRPL
jgi:hypothetical protein